MLSNLSQLILANFNSLEESEKATLLDQLNKNKIVQPKIVPKKNKYDFIAMENQYIFNYRSKNSDASKLA